VPGMIRAASAAAWLSMQIVANLANIPPCRGRVAFDTMALVPQSWAVGEHMP